MKFLLKLKLSVRWVFFFPPQLTKLVKDHSVVMVLLVSFPLINGMSSGVNDWSSPQAATYSHALPPLLEHFEDIGYLRADELHPLSQFRLLVEFTKPEVVDLAFPLKGCS